MELKCFSDLAYSYLKDAAKNDYANVVEYYSRPKAWCLDYLTSIGLDGEMVFTIEKSLPNIVLKEPTSNKRVEIAKADIDNAITVYNSLKNLSPAAASNPRIWAYFCHESLYEYMIKRWPVKTQNALMDRYFLSGESSRSLYRNGISRLWWIAYLTYNPQFADPYYLTKVLLRRQDDMEGILGREMLTNKNVLQAFLKVLAQKDAGSYNRNSLRPMLEEINFIGGVSILDALPEDKLMKLFEKKYQKYVKNSFK